MEKILETILEEIKGVKEEVREIRGEVKDTKQELRGEMQEMKQELRGEMQEMREELKTEILEEVDNKISQQSKEIAEELHQVVIFLEKRDNEVKATMNEALKIQTEMLKELTKIKVEHKEFDYRISKLEFSQERMEERLLKQG